MFPGFSHENTDLTNITFPRRLSSARMLLNVSVPVAQYTSEENTEAALRKTASVFGRGVG